MIRKAVSLFVMLIAVFAMSAQTPLPVNPKVKHGVLPNGMSYYIMHNEMPKERANFYIAQKVGSTLEEESQLGLAHFLEHMAFNGTKNYPGKNMLNYLQGKGIRFGADINAYTSFDETVYNINNVPTTDKALMDSVLLVLHDWSGDILLEEAEIDAERGVIQEEWRQRNDANIRMYTQILPKIYEEYQYHQMPIGKMEVVMNFKPETLRAYYKKWYRPDQQGIVIVGDFDADEMETKVKELFSTIPMPENAAERTYPKVSDNEKPIYVSFTDPELTTPRTTISFKSEKLPFEMRNTMEGYMMAHILPDIISSLINNRLSDNSKEPNCTYSAAGVYFGDFYVSKTKDSFNIVVIPKRGTKAAVEEVMAIVARACKTGFTSTELERVTTEMLSQVEKQYNERDKTNNGAYGNELCSLFTDNEPTPGIEMEFQIMKQVLPNLPVSAINQAASTLLTPNNMVIVTTEPQKEGFEIEAEDVMVQTVTDAMNAQYEAFVDEVITEPLIAKAPKAGKIVKSEENAEIGATTFSLSNGVKVVVKPTDFAADEILFSAVRSGGKQSYPASQANNVNMLGVAFNSSKMGPFDTKTLDKYLAGKQVSINYNTGASVDQLTGRSTVKDLQTLMELIYTSFTNLGADQTTYDVDRENLSERYKLLAQNPQMIFMNKVSQVRFGGNPLMENLTAEKIEAANYPEMLDMIKKSMANAADYTFIFIGNLDLETFRPMLEQYVASLPAGKVTEPKVVTPIEIPTGVIDEEFKQEMQSAQTHVLDVFSGKNLPMDVDSYVKINMVADILDNIYIDTLREQEGGTYGASVQGMLSPYNNTWQLLYYFQTNSDKQEALIKRAHEELEKLLAEGAPADNFNKVKEAMLKQEEINSRKNSWWRGELIDYLRGFDTLTGYRKTVEGTTIEDLNKFMKTLNDGNRIQVVMEGVENENK